MRNLGAATTVAVLSATLSACALPPAISIATFALDAGSYFVSGKTATDHGISLIADGDCAIILILEQGTLCREEREYELAEAVLQPLPEKPQPDPMDLPADLAELDGRIGGLAAEPQQQSESDALAFQTVLRPVAKPKVGPWDEPARIQESAWLASRLDGYFDDVGHARLFR